MKKVCKKLSIAASLFAASMLLCVSPADAKTIKAKSLKLTKKSVSVTVGKTVKLKSKVKVKPAKATLKWSTSKKAVATVTSKGVVKGKKAGTAKITVKSGKKSAKFTVKVKKATGISKVEVLSDKSVRVTLNRAQKLANSKFTLYKKSDSAGKSKKKLAIASVANSANKVYEIMLGETVDDNDNDINYIGNGDFVQVNVAGLAGVKTKTAKYVYAPTPSDDYKTGLVGKKMDSTVSFSSYTTGYSSFTIGALPAGLKATQRDTYVSITGVPTAVVSNFTTTITAKDELDKTVTKTVRFFIGSEDQMVGYAKTVLAPGFVKETPEARTEYAYNVFTVIGGKGYNYTATTTVVNDAVKVSDSYVYIDRTAAAGVYNVPVTVADGNGHSVLINTETKIVPATLITGTVKNAAGIAIEDASVDAEFVKYDKDYAYSSTSFGVYTNDKGVYRLFVPSSKSYDIYTSKSGAEKRVYNKAISTTTTTIDTVLDKLFAITVTGLPTESTSIRWNDSVSGSTYRSENGVFSLKAGTYKLTSDAVKVATTDAAGVITYNNVVYTVDVTVSTNGTVAAVVKSTTPVTSDKN